MLVHRPRVQLRGGASRVELGEGLVAVGVDDEHVVAAHRAQGDGLRGVLARDPLPARGAAVHEALVGEDVEGVARDLGGERAEALAAREGEFERGAPEVLEEHLDVVGVDARLLDGRAGEVRVLAREELIDRGGRGHEHREAR